MNNIAQDIYVCKGLFYKLMNRIYLLFSNAALLLGHWILFLSSQVLLLTSYLLSQMDFPPPMNFLQRLASWWAWWMEECPWWPLSCSMNAWAPPTGHLQVLRHLVPLWVWVPLGSHAGNQLNPSLKTHLDFRHFVSPGWVFLTLMLGARSVPHSTFLCMTKYLGDVAQL